MQSPPHWLAKTDAISQKGTELNKTAVERDLGIPMDNELKSRQQAAAAISKAAQVMAVI